MNSRIRDQTLVCFKGSFKGAEGSEKNWYKVLAHFSISQAHGLYDLI